MHEGWIIDQLIQQGISHFCIAPGSRSTPLVHAAANHPKAKTHVHFDERGLGFFALGLAKATQNPAAIITTSGTAVGNLLPSLMEAYHSCTPLIVLTADRPHELRDCSANQATEQTHIFSSFVRWKAEAIPSSNENYIRSLMAQAHFYSIQNPPGPVHLNCPFKEPLYDPHLQIREGKPIAFHLPRYQIDRYQTEKSRGLILIGRLPKPQDIHPILKLAERLKWPICADILSNARSYPTEQQIRYFDWIEKPTPDFVLHFGERMTSKKLLEWLKQLRPEYIHISPWPQLQDPERILTGRVQADIDAFCQVFAGNTNPHWLRDWKDVEPEFEETGLFTEVHAMRKLSAILPRDYGVFLGNGMPIRDGDHFLFPEQCNGYFSNRGLSGIDGNIGTIAGLAETMPILGIIGDQAALYDLNSLPLLKKTKYPVTLLISNNFGGGIFHHLPVAKSPQFETFWAAGHNWSFEKACQMFDLPYFSFDQIEKRFGSSSVIELITEREANYQYQKNLSVFKQV